MKTLALGLALALQLSGLWPHLPDTTREQIAATATDRIHAAPPPAPTMASNLALPVQLGAEAFRPGANTSMYAFDTASATPLFAQAQGKQRPVASLTKLVTALVILSRHKLDETVTIGQLPQYNPDEVTAGLVAGETYRLEDLLRTALVISANDAADALAIYDAGSVTKFAAQMNIKLSSWNITGARFVNASGLNDGNTATAESLARIALLALEYPFVREAITHTSATIVSNTGRTFSGATTNKLLASGNFYGIKTGYTSAAGECFLGLTRINGHQVITVVLGSSDRFGETNQLVNWISRNYQWL